MGKLSLEQELSVRKFTLKKELEWTRLSMESVVSTLEFLKNSISPADQAEMSDAEYKIMIDRISTANAALELVRSLEKSL